MFFLAVIKTSPSTWCFILESLLTILLAQLSRSSPANLSGGRAPFGVAEGVSHLVRGAPQCAPFPSLELGKDPLFQSISSPWGSGCHQCCLQSSWHYSAASCPPSLPSGCPWLSSWAPTATPAPQTRCPEQVYSSWIPFRKPHHSRRASCNTTTMGLILCWLRTVCLGHLSARFLALVANKQHKRNRCGLYHNSHIHVSYFQLHWLKMSCESGSRSKTSLTTQPRELFLTVH